ncbi:MAG: hypothetical protein BWY80_00904 [Firmicutes bacterium ADurb.Bin456]|nr:MAG: hypothetical protein BWY80_00904 [Firmicutes bacterium ADurb.Bin456]
MDLDGADLFAFGQQEVYSFLDGIADGAHGDDNILGIFRSIVNKRFIVNTGKFAYFFHVVGNYIRHSVIKRIAGFPGLEVNIRVLGSTPDNWAIRIEAPLPEFFHGFIINQLSQIIIIKDLNFLLFMGGSESVKEVKERNPGLDSCQVGYRPHVNYFLYAAGSQHCKPGHPAGHNVGVIAENAQGMGRKRPGSCVNYPRHQFPGDFIHIGDHQHQALGGCIGCAQHTRCKGSVQGGSGASFRLHFRNFYSLTENVF